MRKRRGRSFVARSHNFSTRVRNVNVPAQQNSSSFSLKDQLFNRGRIEFLASLLAKAVPKFDRDGFVRQAMDGLSELELKQRIVHLAECLEDHLATDFRTAAAQIVDSLPPPLDPGRRDDDFGDFIFAPLGAFVARRGFRRRHLRRSLQTLRELTMRFSMEDSIRCFLDEWPDETFSVLETWAADSHYHVRRLVSEGTRPRLPWSRRLSVDPHRALQLLDRLHADPTRYVTRSVANHLNDLSKSEPLTVIQTLQRWKKQRQQKPAELEWMTRHALRTLIKQGDAKAMKLLGYRTRPQVTVSEFQVRPERITAGEGVEICFQVQAERRERLMIDYVVDFAKAGGRRSTRVHKLKSLNLMAGQAESVSKRHIFKANATTYRLYAGIHHITLQINGRPADTASFELTVPG